MKHLPIRDSSNLKELKVDSGVFGYSPSLGGKQYIKVYNDLKNSSTYRMDSLDYGCFNDDVYSATNYTELAKNFTRLYCRLRDNGFFHPCTAFMVGNDSKGKPSMICVMPELKQGNLWPFDNPELKDSLEDYIRTYTSNDMIFNFNYGVDEKGRSYLLDLHVFRDWSHDLLKFKPQR